MTRDGFQYTLSLFRPEGGLLGEADVDPDFAPAVEWALLRGVEEGTLPLDPSRAETRVEPTWAEAGEPYVGGFRVSIRSAAGSAGEDSVARDYPSSYFLDLARLASAPFIESGELEVGGRFTYVVSAFPRPPEPRNGGMRVESSAPPWPVRDGGDLDAMFAASVECGESDVADLPVFLPRVVLEEATDLMLEAGPHETGSVLIGHLRRDAGGGSLFLEVTAQIPARHAEAGPLKLTFTARTWTDVQAAIDLRGRDEQMLGWLHSHPLRHGCEKCERPDRECCSSLNAAFFSAHDRTLHRTIFPRAYSIALVVGDGPGRAGLSWALFGWRRGTIVRRAVHVIGDPVEAVHPASRERLAGENYATT